MLRPGLVRERENSPRVARWLLAYALADAAEALQLVVREELHVESERLIGAGGESWKRLSHLDFLYEGMQQKRNGTAPASKNPPAKARCDSGTLGSPTPPPPTNPPHTTK